MVARLVGLNYLTSRRATSRVDVDQPVGELVLEVVTLAAPVTLDVGRRAVVLEAASGTRERLTSTDRTDRVLQNNILRSESN